MNIEHSQFARNYMAAKRRRGGGEATWLDVAAAYDAGITHAIACTPAQRQALIRFFRALRVINGERKRGKK